MNEPSFSEYYSRFQKAAVRHGGIIHPLSHGGCSVTFGNLDAPRLAVMSGLHGDERSGPLALLHWMEQDVLLPIPEGICLWMMPLVNDKGWDARTRNWGDINLNRSFLPDRAPPFLLEIMDQLSAHPPKMFLDLHEDDRFDYKYVFRYTADTHHLAEELRAVLDARDEPWKPEDREEWKGCSEIFVRDLGCDLCATTETTPAFPLEERIEWSLKALGFFLEKIAQQ